MPPVTTLVLGASEDPQRYANLAVRRLVAAGHPVVAVGAREGRIDGTPIRTAVPEGITIDTVSVYLNPLNQKVWMPRLLALRPRRIILNPGAENPELEANARGAGIEVENACTLALLSIGAY